METNETISSQQELQQMPPNPQIMVQPMISQNQRVQILPAASSPNRCEKFSNCLTGSKNITFAVFTIFIFNALFFVNSLFIHGFGFYNLCNIWASFGNFLFSLFVWVPMATKIEKCSSTARYFGLFFINSTILNVITFCFPLCISKLWCFILFETILISLSNLEKKVKFFGCSITGKKLIPFSVIYAFIFNMNSFFSVIFTVAYAYIYQKKLITKFNITNQKVLKIENFCCCSCFKKNLKTFITLEECMAKNQNSNQVQNSNNSSFVPANIYPNYYSGVANNAQYINQAPPIVNNLQQPMNNINMAGEQRYVPENSVNYEAQPSA